MGAIDDEIWQAALYQRGCNLLEKEDYEGAIEAFSSIAGYKDANELMRGAEQAIEDDINLFQYKAGRAFIKEEKYADAVRVLEPLGHYRDSHELCVMAEDLLNRSTMLSLEEALADAEANASEWSSDRYFDSEDYFYKLEEKRRVQSQIKRVKRRLSQPVLSEKKLNGSRERLEHLRADLANCSLFDFSEKRRLKSAIAQEQKKHDELVKAVSIEIEERDAAVEDELRKLEKRL